MTSRSALTQTAGAFLVGLLSFGFISASLAQRTAEQDDERQAHAWFDTCGFADLSKCPLVLVAAGGKHKSGDGPWRNSYVHGFLVSDDGKEFQIFTTKLDTRSYEKSPPNAPELDRVGYEKLDLKEAVAAHLKHVSNPQDGDDDRHVNLGHKQELFVVAHACFKQGYADEARLLNQIIRTQLRQNWHQGSRGYGIPDSYCQQLVDVFAERLASRVISNFSDGDVSRRELLARFERIIKRYPQVRTDNPEDDAERFTLTIGRHASVARAYADVLHNMTAEDEARGANPSKAEKEMTNQERIADLIYRLRDQNGLQASDGIFSDIFRDERSPAHQLAKIGYPAVPPLIEAINDVRFTRSMAYPRRLTPSQVLRIGDCAILVIGRIAGRNFYNPYRSMHQEGQVEVVKPAVKEWWANFQKHGEKKTLIEGTRAGNRDSIEQGRMLVERYPDAAPEALTAGIEKASDDRVKSSLVAISANLKGGGTRTELRRQLDSTSIKTQVAAAIALKDRGDESGVDAMIKTWRDLRIEGDFDFGVSALVQFLANCNRPDAVKALGHDLDNRPTRLRLEVIEALLLGSAPLGKSPIPDSVIAARDELLVRMLDDATVHFGMTGIWGDKSFIDPRICDLAAHRLSEFWKMPDAFDLSGLVKTRDRQLVELKNIWRKKSGLALLPLPDPKKIERLADSKVKPKLQSFLDAATTPERREIWDSIQAMGLPALPAARDTLAQMKQDQPAYADLKYFTTKMACTVNEVIFGTGSVPPGNELRQRLDQLKGKPLTAEAIVSLAISITRSLPEGVAGIDFTIERCNDDTGVRLTLILVSNELPAGATPKSWRTQESIRVGREDTHGESGSSALKHGTTEAHWDFYRRMLQKALDSSPEKAVTARARLVLDR